MPSSSLVEKAMETNDESTPISSLTLWDSSLIDPMIDSATTQGDECDSDEYRDCIGGEIGSESLSCFGEKFLHGERMY
uniref:Uncharacterized protein n=1 Tax=Pristionchus pacificus TaxID=54126 RepID=A0A2A6C1G4_PRIPA|eukprot:PDM72092.1 hypothetical protein PRIPAC_38526 [Pristionchus pacificus]